MARNAVLLKPNIVNILLFKFCEQKLVQHSPITIAIDCNGHSLSIFEEKWPNYASGPKYAPKSDSFWVNRFSVPQMRQFCLFTYPPRWKWASSEKMIVLAKSASSVSRSQAHLAKRCSSVYKPYSFSGRIKLIICQIRHEISVTIHEISTSWKKS